MNFLESRTIDGVSSILRNYPCHQAIASSGESLRALRFYFLSKALHAWLPDKAENYIELEQKVRNTFIGVFRQEKGKVCVINVFYFYVLFRG